MQKKLILFTLIVICILSFQCKKQKESIDYPSTGNNGPNLLYPQDTTLFSVDEIYSLCADLTQESTLEVHIINLNTSIDTMQWGYEHNSINGWNISSFDTLTHLQKFNSSRFSQIDAAIKFKDPGPFKVEVFENNSSTPQRSTILIGTQH